MRRILREFWPVLVMAIVLLGLGLSWWFWADGSVEAVPKRDQVLNFFVTDRADDTTEWSDHYDFWDLGLDGPPSRPGEVVKWQDAANCPFGLTDENFGGPCDVRSGRAVTVTNSFQYSAFSDAMIGWRFKLDGITNGEWIPSADLYYADIFPFGILYHTPVNVLVESGNCDNFDSGAWPSQRSVLASISNVDSYDSRITGLRSLVQAVVDQPSWSDNGYICFLLKPDHWGEALPRDYETFPTDGRNILEQSEYLVLDWTDVSTPTPTATATSTSTATVTATPTSTPTVTGTPGPTGTPLPCYLCGYYENITLDSCPVYVMTCDVSVGGYCRAPQPVTVRSLGDFYLAISGTLEADYGVFNAVTSTGIYSDWKGIYLLGTRGTSWLNNGSVTDAANGIVDLGGIGSRVYVSNTQMSGIGNSALFFYNVPLHIYNTSISQVGSHAPGVGPIRATYLDVNGLDMFDFEGTAIQGSQVAIKNSVIDGATHDGVRASSVTIDHTIIKNSTDAGVRAATFKATSSQLTDNHWGVYLESRGRSSLNLLTLADNYISLRAGTANINAHSVYWGTTDPIAIRASIRDGTDIAGLGYVDIGTPLSGPPSP